MTEFGDRPRSSFGRYQLLLEMARGGMATLFLARLSGPESFEKLIVIKRIHEHYAQEQSFIQMFLDEARITAAIQHPHVATVFDMGRQDLAYYIAMEYVHGQNMKDLLKAAVRQEGSLHWSMVCRLVADAAAGLHAAHELKSADGSPMNVVHRDVSPQNILVSYDGNVKVVDFGIAYAAERLTSTAVGMVKGKASYMSPEQVESYPVDRRSDIFSLGVVLWEGITMRRLFRADTEAATLLRVRDAKVPPPRQIDAKLPQELERITMKALARDPGQRYATANEMEEDLSRLLVAQGQYVGRKQVETLMDLLFYDRRKIKDEQIHRALLDEHTTPLVAVGMAADRFSSSTSMQMSSSIAPWEGPRISRTALFIGGIVMAALVVTLALVFFSGRGAEPASPGSMDAPVSAAGAEARAAPNKDSRVEDAAALRPVVAPPMVTLVELQVTVLPTEAKATVVFRGKQYPGSDFRTIVPRGESEELIEITAPGYRRESLVLTLMQSMSTRVTLKKEVTAGSMRPEYRPAPMRRPMSLYLDLPE